MTVDYKRFIGKIVRVEWLDHQEFDDYTDHIKKVGPVLQTTVGWLESLGKDFLKLVWELEEDGRGYHGLYLISCCIKSVTLVTEKNNINFDKEN